MDIVSIIDIFEEIGIGQRSGLLLKRLTSTAEQVLHTLRMEIDSAENAIVEATALEPTALISAVEDLIAVTDKLITAHDIVTQENGATLRAQKLKTSVTQAAHEFNDLAKVKAAKGIIPESAKDAIESLAVAAVNPDSFAESLLNLSATTSPETERGTFASLTLKRLWAIHSLLLLKIAGVIPAIDATTPEEVHTERAIVENRIRALRDGAKEAAGRLSDSRADPAFALQLWSLLVELESWVLEDGIDSAVRSSSVATALIASEISDKDTAERVARDAALIYDGLRTALALDAGIRTVLGAYATHDMADLIAYEQSRQFSIGSSTVDIARSSLAEAASAAEGELVEIAGVVRGSDITVGGPEPRSILLLGKPSGTQIRVFVPFMAVDSIGIVPNTWIQVRGTAHPNGKDNIPGPLVQVRRIKLGEAAKSSFFDALIHRGRRQFEWRPGGLDIIGGRLAGDTATTNEMGLRRLALEGTL